MAAVWRGQRAEQRPTAEVPHLHTAILSTCRHANARMVQSASARTQIALLRELQVEAPQQCAHLWPCVRLQKHPGLTMAYRGT